MNKISYALGMRIANTLTESGVRTLNVEDFRDGLKDQLEEKETKISIEESEKLLTEYFQKLMEEQERKAKKQGEILKKQGMDFLTENAKAEGVVVTKSGLQYKVIQEGTGKQPSVHDRVKCQYEGRLTNGHKFDSSYDRGKPAVFILNQVIPGWTEGLQLMKEGAVYEFYIPYQLAYGPNGIPGMIPQFATLIFKVELQKVFE